MLCAKLSPEPDAVETLEVGLSIALPEVQPVTAKRLRAGQGVESKTTVVQCVRGSHRDPDEEHGTNSRPEVTMLLQFQCYAIFQDFTDAVTITTTGRGIKIVTNPASGEVVTGNQAAK